MYRTAHAETQAFEVVFPNLYTGVRTVSYTRQLTLFWFSFSYKSELIIVKGTHLWLLTQIIKQVKNQVKSQVKKRNENQQPALQVREKDTSWTTVSWGSCTGIAELCSKLLSYYREGWVPAGTCIRSMPSSMTYLYWVSNTVCSCCYTIANSTNYKIESCSKLKQSRSHKNSRRTQSLSKLAATMVDKQFAHVKINSWSQLIITT